MISSNVSLLQPHLKEIFGKWHQANPWYRCLAIRLPKVVACILYCCASEVDDVTLKNPKTRNTEVIGEHLMYEGCYRSLATGPFFWAMCNPLCMTAAFGHDLCIMDPFEFSDISMCSLLRSNISKHWKQLCFMVLNWSVPYCFLATNMPNIKPSEARQNHCNHTDAD